LAKKNLRKAIDFFLGIIYFETKLNKERNKKAPNGAKKIGQYMAHNKTAVDVIQSIHDTWHGLHETCEAITIDASGNAVLRQWDVSPVTLTDSGEDTGFRMLKCTDNGLRIGKPYNAGSYTPLLNSEFLDLIQNSIADIPGAKVTTCGSVCGRNRVFASVSLADLKDYAIDGHKFEPFLNFGNSFDMSACLFADTNSHDIVCDNTFRSALHHNGELVNAHIRHTKGMSAKIANLGKLIEAAIETHFNFAKDFERLLTMPCDVSRAESIFAGFLVSGKELSTRARNTIGGRLAVDHKDNLIDLFLNGKGNKGQSLADVFSATTDYYSHFSSGGDDAFKQFVSSEFGSGQNHKAEMFEILTTDKLAKVEQTGQALVASLLAKPITVTVQSASANVFADLLNKGN
jgi:hypothetical protein